MAGIIVAFKDSLASIPTGWLLCNGDYGTPNLLSKYLKSVGAAEDPGATGGNSTHSHTSDAHTHTQDAHSHSYTSASSTSTPNFFCADASGTGARIQHTHLISLASTTATNQNTTVNLAATSSDPPYYKLALIYDSGVYRYPVGSIILWNSASPPEGWSVCDGTSGTIDLRDKFIKCVAADEDPGATGGSSNSHTHTNTAHNHTQDAHSHSNSHGSPSASVRSGPSGTGTGDISAETHSHVVTSTSPTATNQTNSVTINNADGQPTFYKLLYIQNTIIKNRPKNSIVFWSGTIASIPNGYVLCDGNNSTPNLLDYFVKGANSSAELGNTGGSATHTHNADSHNHTQDSHSHTVSIADASASVYLFQNATKVGDNKIHSHSGGTASGTATNQATTITVNSADSEPAYYKVAFIMQYIALDVGAFACMM